MPDRRNPGYAISNEVQQFINYENDPSSFNWLRPQAGDLDSLADRSVTLYAEQRREHRRQLLADGLVQSDGEGCTTAPAPSDQDMQPSRFSKTRRYNLRASQYPHLPPVGSHAFSSKRVKLKSYAVPPVDHKTLGRHVPHLKRLLPRAQGSRYLNLVKNERTSLDFEPRLDESSDSDDEISEDEISDAGSTSSSDSRDQYEGCENYSNESESDGEVIEMGRSDEESDLVGRFHVFY